MATQREDKQNIAGQAQLDLERALSRKQAAEFYGVSPITMDQWRYRGTGPRFFRCGPPLPAR